MTISALTERILNAFPSGSIPIDAGELLEQATVSVTWLLV